MSTSAQELSIGLERSVDHKDEWIDHDHCKKGHDYKDPNLSAFHYQSLFLMMANWPIPRTAMIKKRITPNMAPVPKSPRAKAL